MRRGNRIAEEGGWCGQSEKEAAEIKEAWESDKKLNLI